MLIYTANSNALMTSSTIDQWATNGGGLKVSPQFGFGAVNAEAMIIRVPSWTTVPEQSVTTVTPTNIPGLVVHSIVVMNCVTSFNVY